MTTEADAIAALRTNQNRHHRTADEWPRHKAKERDRRNRRRLARRKDRHP